MLQPAFVDCLCGLLWPLTGIVLTKQYVLKDQPYNTSAHFWIFSDPPIQQNPDNFQPTKMTSVNMAESTGVWCHSNNVEISLSLDEKSFKRWCTGALASEWPAWPDMRSPELSKFLFTSWRFHSKAVMPWKVESVKDLNFKFGIQTKVQL